jgi:hypothetical protein
MSELIRRWEPWQSSTGSLTDAGRAKVTKNTFKGAWRIETKLLIRVLREQKLGIIETINGA